MINPHLGGCAAKKQIPISNRGEEQSERRHDLPVHHSNEPRTSVTTLDVLRYIRYNWFAQIVRLELT